MQPNPAMDVREMEARVDATPLPYGAADDAHTPHGPAGGSRHADVYHGLPLNDEADVKESGYVSREEASGDRKQPASVPRTVFALLSNIIPYGGLLSSGFNLASTTIGAGILGLPAAFSDVGIAMATIYLFFVTAETVYSMWMLVRISERTGLYNYEDMTEFLLGRWAKYVVGVVRAVHTMGANVAYVVTLGNLLKPILLDAGGVPVYWSSGGGLRVLQLALWAIFFLPLVIPREINSLRYVSACGIVLMTFFCIVIVVHSGMFGLQANPRPAVAAVQTGNTALRGLGVFIFSFMCQVKCMDIFVEMTRRDVRRFTLCATISMGFCGTIYFLSGLFGYLDFGRSVKGSVLLMYSPIQNPQVLVSYIGVFIKICASYGLLNQACRTSVFHLIGWDPMKIKFWKHLIGALTLAVISLVLGLFIPNINLVFGFTGGFCGGIIAFILPALFYMYSGNWGLRTVGVVNYVCTYLVLFAGVVAIVFGTASTIYFAIHSD